MYEGQEATVRTGHETMDWFQIGKGVHQGCTLSPYLFNIYAKHMGNAELDESQAEIKTAERNINNLTHAEDSTLMAENKKKLKYLLMRVKEESLKAGLKLKMQTVKIMASDPITSWQIEREKSENSGRFYFLGIQNQCGQ